MRLDNRRMSSNVDDRRNRGGGIRKAGIGGGIGAVVITAIVVWIMGGNPMDVIRGNIGQMGGTEQATGAPSQHEEEYEVFARKILAGTEDVWTEQFREHGLEYRPPKMVLYRGAVESACGNATSAVGPFYCSGDETLYIDLSFFDQMEDQMGAGGDFAFAYVIAHEVGHHVQHLLGTLEKSHSAQGSMSQTEANRMSVRTELQADFYAGIWAWHDNRLYSSLEDGDIEEGLNAASKIGDDYLQKQAQGYAVPETFNHGRSDQRVRWLKLGATTGDMTLGDTFSPAYNDL